MKHIHTFESFLNESKINESTIKISGQAYNMWNDKKIQRQLNDVKIKIIGNIDGILTITGDEKELDKVKAIFDLDESNNGMQQTLDESKIKLNSVIKASDKNYTWIYQTGKESIKTAIRINKELNDVGIKSFISKDTGDTIGIPTKDLKRAFDEIVSKYDDIKQFDYNDGTKLVTSVLESRSSKSDIITNFIKTYTEDDDLDLLDIEGEISDIQKMVRTMGKGAFVKKLSFGYNKAEKSDIEDFFDSIK